MVHSQNNILLIVEGERTEPRIFNKFVDIIGRRDFNLKIINLNTNIYALYNKIKSYNIDFDDDSTSTIDVLKSILKDDRRNEELKILDQKFPYIYLVFDFEIQDKLFNLLQKKGLLLEMLNYFNDETENGLLLINYPMIESLKDFKFPIPNLIYKDALIDVDACMKYKHICSLRSDGNDIRKYNKQVFEKLVFQNICKANYLCNFDYNKPDYNTFMELIVGRSIVVNQFAKIEDSGSLGILCCALFLFVSYYGKEYYEKINFDFAENNENLN